MLVYRIRPQIHPVWAVADLVLVPAAQLVPAVQFAPAAQLVRYSVETGTGAAEYSVVSAVDQSLVEKTVVELSAKKQIEALADSAADSHLDPKYLRQFFALPVYHRPQSLAFGMNQISTYSHQIL